MGRNPLPVGGVLKICSFRYLNSLNKRHIFFDVAEVYKDQCFSHSGMIFGKMDTCSQYLTPNPLPVGGVLKICSFRYLNSLNKRHIFFDVAEVYKDQCFSHSGMIFGKMDTCSQYLTPNPLPVGGVLKIC